MRSIDVIIPTFRPGKDLRLLLDALERQTVLPQKIILMNTDRRGLNAETERSLRRRCRRLEVHHLKKKDFDHGGTRNTGVSYSQAAYFLMLTQDARPVDAFLIERLAAALEEDDTAVAYARQLPKKGCRPEEAYARAFNYPDTPQRKTQADVGRLGVKAYFCSNVCAMYRRDIFDALGGFVRRAIFNEDMIYAGRAMQKGYAVSYVPEAKVAHSHTYTCAQQFRRSFDTGVSQAEHPEIFGGIKSETEGMKYVRQTIRFLLRNGYAARIPYYILQCGCRYIGFQAGRHYRRLPKALILKCSASREYWIS